MTHEIPTHLAVEDKLFAGFTPRQVLLLGLGAALAFSLWSNLTASHAPGALCVVTALLPMIAALVLANARPDGRPMEQWLIAYARYLALPKVSVLAPSRNLDQPRHAEEQTADEAINEDRALTDHDVLCQWLGIVLDEDPSEATFPSLPLLTTKPAYRSKQY